MHLDLDNVEGRPATTASTVQRRGRRRGRRRRDAERCSCAPSSAPASVVPLTASRRGHRRPSTCAITGPGGFALERSYALAVKPATQILTRRTVQADRQGREPDAVERSVRRSRAGHRRGGALGRRLDRARRGDAAQGARPLSVRLLRADHQPRAAAALRQRARERGASRARRRAIDQRIRDAIDRVLARQASNGSFGLWGVGGDDAWLDAYVTDFLTRARERSFAVPDIGVQAGARPAAQHRRQRRRTAPRTAAAISPMRSTCWRATARRRSAICAISPTPSSTISGPRSPRRRSPRRSACSATAPAPSASTRPRSTTSRRRPQLELFSRADYGSTLRDAAALVTLASEAGGRGRSIINAVAAHRGRRARSRPTPRRRRTPGWCSPRARIAKDAGGMSLDVARRDTQGRALPQRAARASCGQPLQGHQHRRRRRCRRWSR